MMPDHGFPLGGVSGDILNDYSVAQRQLFRRVITTAAAELPALLDRLTDKDLRDVKRMTAAAAFNDYDLRHVVDEAVLRRPHRGCWPVNITEGADGDRR